jgi:hypothetical protein
MFKIKISSILIHALKRINTTILSMPEFTINLRTFDRCLSNKKHSILKLLKNILSTSVLCMTKDSNNKVKGLQIHGIPTS